VSAGVLVPQGCSRCDGPIECCEFCEATDCRTPICHRCLRLAVGQAVVQPHAHGG
jgi:hypothetical protein